MTSQPSEMPDLLGLPELSTTKQLAKYLEKPEHTLDQWASRGGGPEYEKVGRGRRYHREDVRLWLESRRRGVTEDAA